MRYITAKGAADIDRAAREKYLIPSIVLMENAGIAAAEETLKYLGENKISPTRIAVFAGKGNNGGDGFVVARQMKSRGIHTDVYLMCKAEDVKTADAAANLRPLSKMGIKVTEINDARGVRKVRRNFKYNAAVDAIFGTGFSGNLPSHISDLISSLNGIDVPVISLDVPTGLDATTGKVHDTCVKADLTVTFGAAKTGFIRERGPEFCGKVVSRNISYPQELIR